eukprot:c10604_g1_i4.p1 GENE.c10604_g1_i4~~c10604_g1_i4.p1  ORF type:complete len:531 (+),score=93.71 c10604_g1_i4:223-1593(+)
MNSFYKYYSGQAKPPCPTLFIGGNHEAANHLHDLFYGGWVSENIFYLGNAGVVNFGGLRIAGLSGIYNSQHYHTGHYERSPYNPKSIRSAYHIREYDVWRLSQLTPDTVDIFLSHDWPLGIAHHGNKQKLFRRKQFLQTEIETNTLGSPPARQLLDLVRPRFWFSAHLHVKFPAVVRHTGGSMTKFLSLDKCLPQRDFLQVLNLESNVESPVLQYDAQWLAITRATLPFLNSSSHPHAYSLLRNPATQKLDFTEHSKWVEENVKNLTVPNNFRITVPPHQSTEQHRPSEFRACTQRTEFLSMIGLSDPFVSRPSHQFAPGPFGAPGALGALGASAGAARDPNEIELDLDGDVATPATGSHDPDEIPLVDDKVDWMDDGNDFISDEDAVDDQEYRTFKLQKKESGDAEIDIDGNGDGDDGVGSGRGAGGAVTPATPQQHLGSSGSKGNVLRFGKQTS